MYLPEQGQCQCNAIRICAERKGSKGKRKGEEVGALECQFNDYVKDTVVLVESGEWRMSGVRRALNGCQVNSSRLGFSIFLFGVFGSMTFRMLIYFVQSLYVRLLVVSILHSITLDYRCLLLQLCVVSAFIVFVALSILYALF